MSKLILIILGFSCIQVSNSQIIFKGEQSNELIANTEMVRMKAFSSIPNYVKFTAQSELTINDLEEWINSYKKSDQVVGLRLLKEETDQLGYTHYKYQQTINGIPVRLGIYLVHVKDGKIRSMNGELFDQLIHTNTITLSEEIALTEAIDYIGAETYKWELASEETHLKTAQEDVNATYYPKGELVYINEGGIPAGELKLTYRFNIYAQEPFGRKEVYVDVRNGEVVFEEDKIHYADVVGTANTARSGTQTITMDSVGVGVYRLQETGRGNGIRTFNLNNTADFINAVDFTNSSTDWTVFNPLKDQYATDAHWGAEVTYDYFLNEHGRNSIDGNGFRLDSYVHLGQNVANAFWDGEVMVYGDGFGNNPPFIALDIVGHEITHGLIQNTANLTFRREPGALAESFGDIFGVSIDYTNQPGIANWQFGEEAAGFVVRDMENPNSLGDPDTYMGINWVPANGPDNGGVHGNAGVQNFWYVLLTDGGIGTNDNGDAYTIVGIGLTGAAQIAFRNLTVYLTPSSDYNDARFFSIQSAVDLFGGCTPEVEVVTNAWYAVGVGPAYLSATVGDFDAHLTSSCSAPFTVFFNNNSANATTYLWDFGDGSTSTENTPLHTYTNLGTYTVTLIVNGGIVLRG